MKPIFSTLLLLSISLIAAATNTFAGDDFGKSIILKNTETFTTTNVHGTCANAYVNITAIENDDAYHSASPYVDNEDSFSTDGHGWISPSIEITLITGNKQKTTVLSLDMMNFVRCITTQSGKKLLIGQNCTGNSPSCERPSYYLIDAEKITKVDTRDGCDAACINKKIGREYIKYN